MTLLRNGPARLFLGLVALFSASWAVFLYNSRQSVQLNSLADGILSEAGSKQNPLSEFTQALVSAESGAICNALEASAAAIIQLRLFETPTDQRLKALRTSVGWGPRLRAPTDGFLWFTAYWSAINQGGAISDHLEALR